VLVGDNDASQRYVRNKRKACQQVGMESWEHQLPASTMQSELLDLIKRLNDDARVHGILVQLPLPKSIDEMAVIRAGVAAQGRDGFGPESLGLLRPVKPRFQACTRWHSATVAAHGRRHRGQASSSSPAATSSANPSR